jgi:hypothetical protein
MAVMTPSEYKILAGSVPTELEKQLNALAAQGWEIVSTRAFRTVS